MPVYNAALYLRECMDSILAQTFRDFELLIVDDGSTDESVAVIQSYADPRIRLIKSHHDYITSLNLLIDEARGKYIARMDADDVMLPHRLQRQWEYMEAHPETDVWAGGLEFLPGDGNDGGEVRRWCPDVTDRPLMLRDFLGNNLFGNPATLIRTDRLRALDVRYEQAFRYAEDYRFWTRLVRAGARIDCTREVFFRFRKSATQTTARHNAEAWEANARVKTDLERWLAGQAGIGYTFPRIQETPNRLTVIIPFANEGEEVEATARSIRQTAGREVDILVIDDASTDGYPYRERLQPYGVYYVLNLQRRGVAASRDYGVSLIRTPYFLLLDGHMRFYAPDWARRIVAALEADDRCLLCCQGRALQKADGTVSDMPGVPLHHGAYLPFIKGRGLLNVCWNDEPLSPAADGMEEIAVVLGAGYAASRRYWQALHGLEGLRSYGSDEPYISLKVWLSGGRCLLLTDVVAGHIYRKSSPFRRQTWLEAYNKLLIAWLLLPQAWRCVVQAELLRGSRTDYARALRALEEEREHWAGRRAEYRTGARRPFADVVAVNRRAVLSDIRALQQRYGALLPQVAAFVRQARPEGAGLCEGSMGHYLWLSHYAALSPDHEAEAETALYGLWAAVADDVQEGRLPLNFRHGLAGIGWALLYLQERGLLKADPAEWIEQIDGQLACLNLARMADLSFPTGAAGLLAYVAERWRSALQAGQPLPWPDEFVQQAQQAAERIIKESTDLTALTYALRIKALAEEGLDEADMPPAVADWMTFGDFIAASPAHYAPGLTGPTLSTSLRVMLSYDYLPQTL